MTGLLRALSFVMALASLVACSGSDDPPSDEEAAAFHAYQVGCQPADAAGHERILTYCNGGG